MWRKALLIGRRILPFVRSAAPITLALGVVVLLAATWWLGPRLEINGDYPLAAWQMRALVTLVVVLLVAMVWGMMLARKLRKVNVAKAESRKTPSCRWNAVSNACLMAVWLNSRATCRGARVSTVCPGTSSWVLRMPVKPA